MTSKGHQAYVPGTDAFKAILATFGDDIVDNATGQIDRRKLGGIVFGDASKMKQLTFVVNFLGFRSPFLITFHIIFLV
jgi:dephospho-CoA kinase